MPHVTHETPEGARLALRGAVVLDVERGRGERGWCPDARWAAAGAGSRLVGIASPATAVRRDAGRPRRAGP